MAVALTSVMSRVVLQLPLPFDVIVLEFTLDSKTSPNEQDGFDFQNVGNQTLQSTNSTGGDGAHSNIPPVLAINFIIKN